MTLTRLERFVLATLGAAATLAVVLLVVVVFQIRRHNAAMQPQLEAVYRLTPQTLLERDATLVAAHDGPPVNADTATREELQAAGGIGKALAQHIVELRAANGGHLTSLSQLATLHGLTRPKLARLERRLIFGNPGPGTTATNTVAPSGLASRSSSIAAALRPAGVVAASAAAPVQHKVNINAVLETELAAVPHVGLELARRILALRDQRGGSFRSLDELLEVKGISNRSLARLADFIEVR